MGGGGVRMWTGGVQSGLSEQGERDESLPF